MTRRNGRTARQRAAERWADAESAVTKALLLGVFGLGLVAQFVRPVGDALEGKTYLGGAILSLVGFVLYTEVRRLNDALRPEVKAEVQTAELGQYFDRALEAKKSRTIRIDAIGFTGETVLYPISRSLEALDDGARRQVTLRILVPDFTAPMAIPGMLDDRGRAVDDPDFRADLLRKVQDYGYDMRALTRRLRQGERAELDARFRVLRITPLLKFCLINGEELFDGIYDKVEQRPARTPPERQVLDLMGYHAVLTRWRAESGAAAGAKVAQRQDLFDTLWRVASPLDGEPSGGAD
ncbi:ATP/GTP-binding protein [Streptomyces sp. NPDC058284]|uniref:ATP/GTP-binding protein n=1 Tax=unclassified Streptomyces TaxID=2593676 RepID=UPI00365B9BEA